MSVVMKEDVISFAEAVREADRLGHPVALATVYRWTRDGAAGHRLDCGVIAGKRVTSRQAVARLVAVIRAAKA
jgi:hypothetical protein